MLINRDIYEHALALLSLGHSSSENEDLAEQAPYHLAAFCIENEDLDHWLSGSLSQRSSLASLPLEEDFPLCDRLAPAAALYLAAMLILYEDTDRSDRLYDRYTEELSNIRCGIPATLESIKEIYI